MSEREQMQCEVLIVGGGPAGLACAIRLRQLKPDCAVCVIEKGASIGAHSLSGAILDPRALDALLPAWREKFSGSATPVREEQFLWLTRKHRVPLPTPPPQRNAGHLIVSLGALTRFLAQQAEELGVEVFAGFAGSEMLYAPEGSVCGVQLGDMGRKRDGREGPNFAAGAQIRAPVTILAEGCRGSLSQGLIERFKLHQGRSPQSYALGFKERWQLPSGRTRAGWVQHSVGWPLDTRTYGGGFIYHLPQDQLLIGLVVGLEYRDPSFKPFEAFQQFKAHPHLQALLQGGEPQEYGARAIVAGGWQALPQLEMPGALLIGDAAGTLNVARLKGIHQAMYCGMSAADFLCTHSSTAGFDAYWRSSPAAQELYAVRNIKPAFKHGLWWGLANGAFETLTGGHSPWTLAHAPAYPLHTLEATPAHNRGWVERVLPPRDRAAAVYLSSLMHDEDQPVHLHVSDPSVCATRCASEYANPCTRFCPAGVYEMLGEPGAQRLHINAANCVHCKACDIKDPYQIITWLTPEGGSGPNYQKM